MGRLHVWTRGLNRPLVETLETSPICIRAKLASLPAFRSPVHSRLNLVYLYFLLKYKFMKYFWRTP
eukprot:COSAG01_NODE_45167_length_412_cov_0.412141_1_plen_65_part_10